MSGPPDSVEPVKASSFGGFQFHHPRLRRAADLAALGVATYNAAKKARTWLNARRTFTVSLPADDDLYGAVHSAILERLSPAARQAMTARSKRSGDAVLVSDSTDPDPVPPLQLFYDGSRSQRIVLAGHNVAVSIERPAFQTISTGDDGGRRPSWLEPDRLVFTTTGIEARDAVLEFLQELHEANAKTRRLPRFFMATRWGEWMRRRDVPPRALSSVVLAAGQKERIVADIERFLAAEADYNRLGMPWHRGYLFEGPPGTGKTSLAKAIAVHFDFDVYYLPLSDITEDTNLLQLFANVDPRSLLVIEDLDIAHATKERDDSRPGISMSALLNGLDGFATPHGLITVMTTNDLAALDTALTRRGRADLVEHIGYLADDQLRELVTMLTGRTYRGGHVAGMKLTAADIVEIVKANLDTPDGTQDAIAERVSYWRNHARS